MALTTAQKIRELPWRCAYEALQLQVDRKHMAVRAARPRATVHNIYNRDLYAVILVCSQVRLSLYRELYDDR